jgi:hypothetical protein
LIDKQGQSHQSVVLSLTTASAAAATRFCATSKSIARRWPHVRFGRDRAQRLHPDIAAAVARAPAELSGVSESIHGELVNDMLRKTHGAELAKVAADVAALEIADELIRGADKEIRSAADVAHSTDFRVWAKPLVEPILTEAGTDFDEVYRRQDSEELNVLGALAAKRSIVSARSDPPCGRDRSCAGC